MPNKQVNETLDKIIALMLELKLQLTEKDKVEPQTTPAVHKAQSLQKSVSPQPSASNSDSNLDSFDALRTALNSNRWPEAVNPHLICNPKSTEDKIERARGIIELMIEEDLKNTKFLDFGCGEGHTACLSADYKTTLSMGYDVKEYDSWSKFNQKDNLAFTTNYESLLSHGPFDIIVIFDVLDHITNDTPVNLLTKAKNLMSDKGKIYMRTHPFVSRHGTHLYHEMNKAYIHLVFNKEELKELIPSPEYEEPSINVTTPIMSYDKFIKEAGLQVLNRRDITEKVEPFFKIPKIAERIIANTKMNFFPEYQMSLQFLDYVLVKAQ